MRASMLAACAALATSSAILMAEPFTYQGRLTDATLPATGSYDMIFRVYSAATGGDLIASATVASVPTLDGLIIAAPDFPTGTFTGATVYLDISVRHSGATLYSRLSPRQPITPAPLAMRSLNERWTPLSATRIRTDEGVTSVVINDVSPFFGDTALMVTSETPAGSLGGMYMNTLDATGIPYYGWSANRVSLAEARVEGATNTFILRSATTDWIRISTEGRVGIGMTPTASERLRVNGNIYSTADITAASDVVANGTVTATGSITTSSSIAASGNITSSGEITADAYNYTSVQARAISLAPEAFHPASQAQEGFFGGGNGYAYLVDSVGSGAMTTGVCLPDGAVVTGFDVYVIDNSAVANLSISLSRRGNAASGYTNMAEVDSAGASASVVTLTDSTVLNQTIDNFTYNYKVWVYSTDWQGIDMVLKGVRIRYSVPAPD